MFNRVLMVCVGNICRSPMAEGLLASRLTRRGAPTVGSAGVAAPAGRPADPIACRLMKERGIDISGHRARQLLPEMLRASDLVLVMDGELEEAVEDLEPACRGRIHRIGRFGDFDVPDPAGGSRADFERTLALIDRGLTDYQRVFWSSP